MKGNIFDLDFKNSSKSNPCDLVGTYLMCYEETQLSIKDWIATYDWESEKDIKAGILKVLDIFYKDEFLRNKNVAEYSVNAELIFRKVKKLLSDEEKMTRYPTVTASAIWNEGYGRAKRKEKTLKMFKDEPNEVLFNSAAETIKKVYSLTDNDIQKLQYFVEQVKAGASFPNSLRRMLYIWSKNKKTGKTTVANAIVSTLNGDYDIQNISHYSSELAYEMQIKSFAVPKISECDCVLMDECFYADMGKTYADFKKFITSSGGHARKPYGQEFVWEGYPNYVATSNEPLQKFIKDWDDRRYLSIEFAQCPTKTLPSDKIISLWRQFIVNSQRTLEWEEWTEQIYNIANEVGEKGAITSELEIDLQQSFMLNMILNTNSEVLSDERITMKKWIGWFSESLGYQEANKRRAEIEQAVINVYGERYSNQNYWRLKDLQTKAQEIKDKNTNDYVSQDKSIDIVLPF